MKSFFILIILLALHIICRADYWNSDLRLPRLKGVRKILIKETRWDDATGKQAPLINRSVLWLNKAGLVIREDDYEQYSWFTGYNIYEYIGDDTAISIIRIFAYPGMEIIGRKPSKKDSLVQTVEFVDEHSDSQRHEWLFYGIGPGGSKRLMNSTSTYYNSNHQMDYSLYKSFGTIHYTDSTAYRHAGDTLIAVEYTTEGAERSQGQYTLKRQEITVIHRDSLGRVISSDRIADTYSGMLRKEKFIYDKQGRYMGERYEQQCEHCKTGWLKGSSSYTYDAKSRLKSVVHKTGEKVLLQYELVYVE